jgi:hypothetical protein
MVSRCPAMLCQGVKCRQRAHRSESMSDVIAMLPGTSASERMTGRRNVRGFAPRALPWPPPSNGERKNNQAIGPSFDFNWAALT